MSNMHWCTHRVVTTTAHQAAGPPLMQDTCRFLPPIPSGTCLHQNPRPLRLAWRARPLYGGQQQLDRGGHVAVRLADRRADGGAIVEPHVAQHPLDYLPLTAMLRGLIHREVRPRRLPVRVRGVRFWRSAGGTVMQSACRATEILDSAVPDMRTPLCSVGA